MSDTLLIKPIDTFSEALDIAHVRNSGAKFMTHNQREIKPDDQAKWFIKYYQIARRMGKTVAFIGKIEQKPVAYGLINRKDDDYWLTGVIVPEAQGQGYGRQLFQHLTDYTLDVLSADRVMLDVLETNEKAINLYKSLGYAPVSAEAGLIKMELKNE